MSIEALSLVFNHSQSKASARLVLIAIANFDGEQGSWPSHETVSRISGGLNRRTVQRAIEELVKLGEIEAVNRTGTSNHYNVILTCPSDCDNSKNHRKEGGRSTDRRWSTDRRGGGLATAGGAVSTPPEPIVNHKEPIARSTTLPNNFSITESMITWAAEKAPTVDIEKQTEKFELYHSSKGSKFVNWQKAWMNWMLNAKDWNKTIDSEVDPYFGRLMIDKD